MRRREGVRAGGRGGGRGRAKSGAPRPGAAAFFFSSLSGLTFASPIGSRRGRGYPGGVRIAVLLRRGGVACAVCVCLAAASRVCAGREGARGRKCEAEKNS